MATRFVWAFVALLILLGAFPAIAHAQEVPDVGALFESSSAISLAAAVGVIPVVVGDLKPLLRPLFRRYTTEPPWRLVAHLVGVGWAVALWSSGHGPEWLSNWPACILAGIALGVVSGKVRDTYVDAADRRKTPPAQSPPPGAYGPGGATP